MTTIIVKVAQVPGSVKELAMNEGATITNALDMATIRLDDDYAMAINGENTDDFERTLNDGDIITISKGAKAA